MERTQNPLVSTSKTSDSRQTVQLHPLVLLTVSDYITRHTLRKVQGPIVGAVLGSQHGRDITMEHAFECKTTQNKDEAIVLDEEWFKDRLQQYRDVHKAPALELVGWFTLASRYGPQDHHLSIQRQLAEGYNESILFMAFHPSPLTESASSSGDKLPITIYEPVYEAAGDDGDKVMEASGEAPALALRFKELPYTVETGDAEMIGVDSVAKGGASAAVAQQQEAQDKPKSKDKGKSKTTEAGQEEAPVNYLTTDEEDLIAAITAKANAIKMLQRRITLIKKYLESLPSCYLTDTSIQTMEPHKQISHPILRSIASLLARLPLVIPQTPIPHQPNQAKQVVAESQEKQEAAQQQLARSSMYSQESTAQATDVALIKLLGTLGSTLQKAEQVNKKAQILESEWNKKRGNKGFYDPVSESMMDVPIDTNGDWPMEVAS